MRRAADSAGSHFTPPRIWCARRQSGIALALGFLLIGAPGSGATDSDSDGMPDSYETFFQLDPTNAADGVFDNDADGLANSNEAALATDPWVGDTDRDDFPDATDSNPLSRAAIAWGEPLYTFGDDYAYPTPPWWVGAWKESGEWATNPVTAWLAGAALSNDTGCLLIAVDRSQLTNDARLALVLRASPGATLYADLDSTNGWLVAANLFGNLAAETETDFATNLLIPLVEHPAAAMIRLRRGTGEISVRESLLYVDEDGDGLDSGQESQLGTSEASEDSDSDGVGDRAEVMRGTDPLDNQSGTITLWVDTIFVTWDTPSETCSRDANNTEFYAQWNYTWSCVKLDNALTYKRIKLLCSPYGAAGACGGCDTKTKCAEKFHKWIREQGGIDTSGNTALASGPAIWGMLDGDTSGQCAPQTFLMEMGIRLLGIPATYSHVKATDALPVPEENGTNDPRTDYPTRNHTLHGAEWLFMDFSGAMNWGEGCCVVEGKYYAGLIDVVATSALDMLNELVDGGYMVQRWYYVQGGGFQPCTDTVPVPTP